MTTRTIIGPLRHPESDLLWVSATLTFQLRAPFVSSGATYPTETISATTDVNGQFSVSLAVPASGTVLYIVTLPDGRQLGLNLSAGSATTLHALLAAAQSVVPQSALQTAIDALTLLSLADTPDTYAGHGGKVVAVRSDVSGVEFISGGGGAPSGTAGGVLGGTYPDPTFASDMATQAELDTHVALGTAAHGGIPLLAAANTFTLHNAVGASAAPDSYTPFTSGLTFSIPLIAAEEMTVAGTKQRAAIGAYLKFNPVGVAPGNTFAIDAEVETTAGNVQTHGTSLIGIFGSALHKNAQALTNVRGLQYFVANQAGATVTSVQGIFLEAQNTASGIATNLAGLDINLYNSSSAVTTNAYGVKIAAPVNSATITNNYGVHIGNITGGATLNYAILTNGGQVRHLTGAAAVIGMVVQGATSQSANLQEWQDVSANVLGSVSSIGAALFRPLDAVTNTVTPALTLGHESSGTPAASFGTRLLMQLESTTTSDQDAAAIDAIWTTATHATRTSAISLKAVTAAGALTEGIRVGTTGITLIGGITNTSLLAGTLSLVANGGIALVQNNTSNANSSLRLQSGFTIATGQAVTMAFSGVITATFDVASAAASSAAVVDNLILRRNPTSGTPAAGTGQQLRMTGKSSTTNDRDQLTMSAEWVVATEASQTARVKLNVFDTAAREAIRLEASGSAAMIGFLGAAAVVRQTLSAAAGDPATTQTLANDLRTALINLGLAA